MKKEKSTKGKKNKSEDNERGIREYGVVLKKDEKYRHRIYPQKGNVPEDDEDYRIV
ncbi:MAG: hypothetical protein ACFFCV_09930 [Promethearchaeota archaeon]